MAVRKVKRISQYEMAVANVTEDFPRAGAIFKGAEWSIQRSPESDGVKISKIDVWRARVFGPDLPSHFIFYAFDDLEVRFLTVMNCQDERISGS